MAVDRFVGLMAMSLPCGSAVRWAEAWRAATVIDAQSVKAASTAGKP